MCVEGVKRVEAWSLLWGHHSSSRSRFGQLMHFNTPVLKQRSNFSAFFEHLVAPGAIIESYR